MKVLIIGLGSIAKKHINALTKIDQNLEVYALRSGTGSADVEKVTSIFRYEDIPDDIDFSIISNPTSRHAETIEALAHLGKPLFIEKPVLHQLEEVSRLSKLIEEKQILTYIGCNLRFHPIIKRLKQEVQNRRPIELNAYCGSYLPLWRPASDYRKIYSAIKELGGGVHLDLIHELDYVIYLLGKPEGIQSYRSRKSGLEINSVDVSHYMLEYPDSSAFITTNYYRVQPKRTIECIWDDDVWTADLISGTLISGNSGEILSGNDILETYTDQMKYFCECIQDQRKMMNDFSEAIEILKICLN